MVLKKALLGSILGVVLAGGLVSVAPKSADAYVGWRGGRWYHGPHGGHLGWWWITAGSWYFYPRPAYPYPVYVTPPAQPVVVEPVSPPVATVIQPQAIAPVPQAMTLPMPTVPPGYTAGAYYYCGNPRGYYPYVPNCSAGWTAVPVNPTN